MENFWMVVRVIAVAVVALIGFGCMVAGAVSYYNGRLLAAIRQRLEASEARWQAEQHAADERLRFSQQLWKLEKRLQTAFSQQLKALEARSRADREASEKRLQAAFSQQLQASEERLQTAFSQQLKASEARLRTEQQASEKRLQGQISTSERAVRAHVDQQSTAFAKLNEVQHSALEAKVEGVSEEVKQAAESVTVLRTEVSRLEGYAERRVVEALRGTSGSTVGQG